MRTTQAITVTFAPAHAPSLDAIGDALPYRLLTPALRGFLTIL